MLRHYMQKNPQPDGMKMEADLRGATNFNDRSDYSVALMYLGRSKEAVELLQQLETEQPGQYFIAANLGTAYELSGNNQEALRWIKEGIHRNPDSHEGTEWLHVKILEGKIAQQKDAHHFENHSVLELLPEKIGYRITIGEEKLSPKELTEAIQYQLAERLQFVKPPDPAVASLLFDYAAIEAATPTLSNSVNRKSLGENGASIFLSASLVAVLDSTLANPMPSVKVDGGSARNDYPCYNQKFPCR